MIMCLFYLGLQCLANTSRIFSTEKCVCPVDCNSMVYNQEISSEQLYPLYSQTFSLMSNEGPGNYLWTLEQDIKNAISKELWLGVPSYEAKILEDRYDDIVSSSSVVHFYFKEKGIMKYSQEEVFGATEFIGNLDITMSNLILFTYICYF